MHRSERRLRMLPKHYIFNHIPKTGGNTLLTICRHNLMPADFSPHLTEHEIRLMPAARFERFPLVVGHFSVLTQAGFCRSRYSMTLLRDPILVPGQASLATDAVERLLAWLCPPEPEAQ